jgi:transcriptional regulator with XRE-family HTH domain
MKFEYDGQNLVKALRTKRLIDLEIDIREAAKQIGTSAGTLSRVENGNTPDLLTLASLCYWSGINMYDCVKPVKAKSKNNKK